MVLVSQAIPNLIGGISQQPATFRRGNQCTDSLNTYNNPVSGVKKRPGSQFVSNISETGEAFYGAIDRDGSEQYIFSIKEDGIKIWTIEGEERTVTAPEGFDYLLGSTDYKYITIADTTFIVNPTVEVGMSADLSPTSASTGLIFIRAIDYSLNYTVQSNIPSGPVDITYTTGPGGVLDTTVIAEYIADQLNAQPGVTATNLGPVVQYIIPGTHNMFVSAGLGDDYFLLITDKVENFGDLPNVGFDGTITRISQNPTTDVDDYFVRFDGVGSGQWNETVAPGIQFKLDRLTMPHILQRQSDGSFEFRPFDWADRTAGDESSNPNPSFVGRTINNILFERNRLGLLSDVNCILSESGNLNNFFRTTVSTIVDSDVIDISVSGRQVDILQSSIGVKDGILLFSEEAQFLLNVGDADILSPETASIVSVSSYQSNTDVEPARVGDSILFLTRRDQNTGVREYFYQSSRDFTQSASIAEHIPSLIPEGIKVITGSSTENIVFFASDVSPIIYTYQYLFNGEEKVVSAWSKWRFGTSTVKFCNVFDDYLYLVLDDDADLSMVRVPLSNEFRQEPFTTELCLDGNQTTLGLPRTVNNNQTTFVLDRDFRDRTVILVSLGVPSGVDTVLGDVVEPLSLTTLSGQTTIILDGDWSSTDFFVGTTYDFQYEFTPPYLSIGNGDVEIEGRLQIRNVSIALDDTGDCQFRVVYGTDTADNTGRFISGVVDWEDIDDMSTLTTFSEELGGEIYQFGRAFPGVDLDSSLSLSTFVYRVPIQARNTDYRLIVESDGWQPITLAKAQWEGLYHKRSRLNQ